MPIDTKQKIPVADDDELQLAVSAHIQTFRFKVTQFRPDSNGSYTGAKGELIGTGSHDSSEWSTSGSRLRGSRIKICIRGGGNTGVSQHEIVAQMKVARTAGGSDDLPDLVVPAGLEDGKSKCITLEF